MQTLQRTPALFLLAAALTGTGASAFAAQAEPQAAAASQSLSEPQVRVQLQAKGYTHIDDVEFEDGMWKAKATSADGKDVKLNIDPASGEVVPNKAVSQVSKNDVRAKLTAAGYRKIHDVELDDGIWKAKARDSDGHDVKLRLSPSDGSVVSSEKD